MSKLSRTWGCVDLVHQGQHRRGVLGRPLVGFQRERHAAVAGGVAEPPQVVDDRPPLGASAGWPAPETQILAPNQRAANWIRRSVSSSPSRVRMSAPPTLQPLTLTPWRSRCSQKACAVAVVGLLGDHDRLGDHQAAEIVPAQRQLEMIDAGLPDSLDGRPDARGPVAVGEAAQNSLHGLVHGLVIAVVASSEAIVAAQSARSGCDRLDVRPGNSLPGSTTRKANRPFEHVEQELAAEARCASLAARAGRRDRSRPSTYQRTSSLRSATLATIEPAIWFCAQHCASAAESRLVTVESPGGSSWRAGKLGKLVLGHGAGLVEDRQDLLTAVQERGPVEVAERFEAAAIRGLPLGDGHQQIVAQDLAHAAGSAAGPRPRASRRAGEPSPGSGGSS